MPVSTQYYPEIPLVEVVWVGDITSKEFAEANAVQIQWHLKDGITRFLNDLSRTDSLPVSLATLFNLPAVEYERLNVDKFHLQIALIKPDSDKKEASELVEFYVDACVNRGWDAQIFTDRELAIQWLQEAEHLPEFTPEL